MAHAKNRGYQVHDSGDHRTLDGIFRLISLGERDESLEDVLTAMCGDIAAIASADVASVYVREEGPEGERFTMRGNVGFPREALGRVHLGRGEGITGFAADRLRPVSVADADRDARFKYIPGLGEEQFPALLAVPILRVGAAAGVLVLQRRAAKAFTPEEVVLATALAAVINHALERGEGRERQRAADADRRTVRLGGIAIVGGTAMGRAEALPTLAALARTGPAAQSGEPAAALETIWARLRGELQRARGAVTDAAAREMASLAMILEDERFRGRLAEACASATPLKALSELARAYARVPFSGASGDEANAEWLGARAAEIEDLCVLVYAGATTRGRPLVRSGAVLASERLGLFSTAYAIAAGASAFVADGDVPADGGPAALARAAGRPLLASVRGLYAWLRPEDLLVVDADAGIVRINPPATTVARFRSDRAER
ncbi:MAG TPA: GAF domain-containing protein [Polyangia bacterium]|nr:GAF domain-containing protein [Polyangia bacterium]